MVHRVIHTKTKHQDHTQHFHYCKIMLNIIKCKITLMFRRALADMNNDGKMDMLEFSIAMKLIKLKLQGHPLPPSLPPAMKQQPISIPPQPPFGKNTLILMA